MARLRHELKVCLFGSCKATDILDKAGLHIIKTNIRDIIVDDTYRTTLWFAHI